MTNQAFLDRIKAEPGVPGVTLILIAEIERLQAERDEIKGRLSALTQVCELIQPFIDQKFVVAEIKAAVESAKR